MISMRALCLAGALTLGLGAAASAQSIGISTPFGGVGVYGPDRYAYGYDRYDHRGYGYRDRVGFGAYAYAPGVGPYGDAYAYDPVYEAPVAPRSNLNRANPHANPDVRRGWSEPEQDRYRSQMGLNSY